jgi:hypothetical protein
MGMNTDSYDFLLESTKAVGIKTFRDKWLLELGNQYIRPNLRTNHKINTEMSKVHFLNMGCYHHSIDWNGKDGAIPIDLTYPVPIPKFMKCFDIVTDFGDMEHVRGFRDWMEGLGHWNAWKNIHDMGKVDCLYVHTVPMVGSFTHHGSYHYTIEFFEKLCKANDYEIVALRSVQCDPRTKTREYVFCSYVKSVDQGFAPVHEVFKGWLHR